MGNCVTDSFNRSDGSLGTSDSGHAWTTAFGTIGIQSNRVSAGVFLGVNCGAYTDHGYSRVRFSATVEHAVGTIRSGGGFLIRYKPSDSTFLLAHTLSDTAANPRMQIWTHAGLQRDEFTADDHNLLECFVDGDDVTLRWSGGAGGPEEISWATTLNSTITNHGPFTFRNASGDPNVMDNYQACPLRQWWVGVTGWWG